MYQGVQIHQNQMIITDANDPLDIVYDPAFNTVVSLATEHVVPANTLTNGQQYQARIRVAPKEGQWSEWSDPIKFWCFGTPVFNFIIDGEDPLPGMGSRSVNVRNSSVAVSLYYYQAQKEGLKSFRVDLYGSDGRKILEGQERYNTGDIRYDTRESGVIIRGLEDNKMYSIQGVGETDHGMVIYTERVYLSVNYEHPATFSLVEVENIAEDATILVHSNLILFEGYSNQNPVKYIGKQRVDLTDYGAYVVFDQGFTLNKDFTIHLIGNNFHSYSDIFSMANGDCSIELRYMQGWFDEERREWAYLKLTVNNATGNYEIFSNFMPVPYFDDHMHIFIRRIGSIYELNWCVYMQGDHQILNPKCFDTRFLTSADWDKVTVEGYRNIQEQRLEF